MNDARLTSARSARFCPRIERLEDRRLLAGIPQLLADINAVTAGSEPEEFVEAGGILYFTAEEGPFDRELWRSDGTANSTYRLTDLDPDFSGGASPRHLAASGGRVYFAGYTEAAGWELWTSDGTPSGTKMLRDIWVGGHSMPQNLVDVAGTLYFTAEDGEAGRELWKSDGTAEGTVRVVDLKPGIQSSYIQEMAAVGGTLYFTADDPAHYGTQLWKSDGTDAGTVIVRHSSDGPINPFTLTPVGDKLFFRAHSDGHDRELWVTDGSAAVTRMVKDIAPGNVSSHTTQLTAVGDDLYFVADDGEHGGEVWKSDGTEAGTILVEDLRPGPAGSYPRALTNVAGTLYFSYFDADVGFELFRTDATSGVVLVKDIRPGDHPYGGPLSSEPGRFTAVGDRLFFFANDGVRGYELWISDGTAGGTTLVRDIAPSDAATYRETRLAIGDRLFFVADDAAHGAELWSSDGTATDTELVKEIRTDTLSSNPTGMTNLDESVYFFADDGAHGAELWRTDGTATGTILVKDIHAGPQGSVPFVGGSLTVFNGQLYFNACDAATGCELWTSDGSETGTFRVKDLLPGGQSGYPTLLTASGDQLYFVANGQIWRTDGTEAGTTPIPNVPTGVLFGLTNVDGALMFAVRDDQDDLWKTDGTLHGTMLVKSNIPDLYPVASRTVVDGLLYFNAGGAQPQLWRSDGTTEGTFPLAQVPNSGFDQFANGSLPTLNDEVYFIGGGEAWGGLFKTDGTPAGTVLVKNFAPEEGRSIRSVVGTAGDAVYFIASDLQGTHEVWKTDGTPEGTTRDHSTRLSLNDTIVVLVETVVDDEIIVGMAGESGFRGLCSWGGPTLGGTNVSPAQESCRSITPWSVHSAGDRLFFTYDDGVHGTELWVQQSTPNGDFDDDHDVDVADIDRLAAEIRAGTHDAAFDVSNDGQVNFMDLAQVVTGILGSQLGDTNLDRIVDRHDVAALSASFGRSNAPGWSRGDLDGDGRIDARDLAILQSNLTPPVFPSAPAAVRATAAPRAVAATRRVTRTPSRPTIAEPPAVGSSTLSATRHRSLPATAVDTAHTEDSPRLAGGRRSPLRRGR